MVEQVYDRYYDTAGNYHWIGVHSGEHIVRKGERMTNKEAIKWLERIEERYILCGDEGFDKARKKALHMAIEALERKHGEWLDYEDVENSIYGHVTCLCSVCGHVSQYKENYCMHCGAYMRGDEDEHTN